MTAPSFNCHVSFEWTFNPKALTTNAGTVVRSDLLSEVAYAVRVDPFSATPPPLPTGL